MPSAGRNPPIPSTSRFPTSSPSARHRRRHVPRQYLAPSFDFNKQYRDGYSFGSEGGPLDYYILYGPDPKSVVKTWAWLVGTTPLPPLWSLGYQQSRYSYYPEAEVRRIASKLRSERIPADVIWLDIDYQLKNRPFTVDPERSLISTR